LPNCVTHEPRIDRNLLVVPVDRLNGGNPGTYVWLLTNPAPAPRAVYISKDVTAAFDEAPNMPVTGVRLVHGDGGHTILLMLRQDAQGLACTVGIARGSGGPAVFEGDECAAAIRLAETNDGVLWAASDDRRVVVRRWSGRDTPPLIVTPSGPLTANDVTAFDCLHGPYIDQQNWYVTPGIRPSSDRRPTC
jgi:hypothetical protein